MRTLTATDFQRLYWFTPYQLRDMYIEEACLTGEATTKTLQEIKNLGAEEQARRKSLPTEFVECPYCKGYHKELNNNDNLCEKCEWTVHILRWDIEHGLTIIDDRGILRDAK